VFGYVKRIERRNGFDLHVFERLIEKVFNFCEAATGSRSDRESGKRLSKSRTSVIAFFLPMS
jgi:hypothetical protein